MEAILFLQFVQLLCAGCALSRSQDSSSDICRQASRRVSGFVSGGRAHRVTLSRRGSRLLVYARNRESRGSGKTNPK